MMTPVKERTRKKKWSSSSSFSSSCLGLLFGHEGEEKRKAQIRLSCVSVGERWDEERVISVSLTSLLLSSSFTSSGSGECEKAEEKTVNQSVDLRESRSLRRLRDLYSLLSSVNCLTWHQPSAPNILLHFFLSARTSLTELLLLKLTRDRKHFLPSLWTLFAPSIMVINIIIFLIVIIIKELTSPFLPSHFHLFCF